jgi:hypothetical protein
MNRRALQESNEIRRTQTDTTHFDLTGTRAASNLTAKQHRRRRRRRLQQHLQQNERDVEVPSYDGGHRQRRLCGGGGVRHDGAHLDPTIVDRSCRVVLLCPKKELLFDRTGTLLLTSDDFGFVSIGAA